MFNRLKRALEDAVAEKLVNLIDNVDSGSAGSHIPPPSIDRSPRPPKPLTINTPLRDDEPEIDLVSLGLPALEEEPFVRVEKAPEAYPRLSSFSMDDLPKLIEALDDPDPEQQVHAIQMAHELMKQKPSQIYTISDVLVDVMQTDPDAPARAAAAEALNRVKNPGFKHQATRSHAGLAERERYERVRDALATVMLEDDDLLTRQNAAESLALTGTDSAMRQVFTKLWNDTNGDFDPFIKVVASIHIGAGRLKRLKGDDRIPLEDAILQAYHDYPDMEEVIRVQIQTAEIARAVPYINKVVCKKGKPPYRKGLVDAIGRLGGPYALQSLLVFMKHQDILVSTQAIAGLNRLKDPRAKAPLEAFKRTLKPTDKRQNLINSILMRSDEVGSISDYKAILEDDQKHSDHRGAISALGTIGGDEAIDCLTNYLKNTRHKTLAQETYRVLLDHPSDAVAHAMIDRVCDGVLGYRQVAYNFVAKMRMTQAVKWLDEAVDTRPIGALKAQIEQDREILKRM